MFLYALVVPPSWLIIMPRENKTRIILLGLLAHEPLTGYDVRKRVESSVSNFWSGVSYGQIYPTLKTLEKEGLVTMKVKMQDTRPNRKVYTITKNGQKELESWLMNPPETDVWRIDVLLKLFFGRHIDLTHNIALVDEYKKQKQNYLGLLQSFENNLKQVLEEDDDHFFFLLTVLMGKKISEAQVEWADTAAKLLRKKVKSKKHLQ